MARNPYKHPALRRKRTTRKREFSLQLMIGSPGNRDKSFLPWWTCSAIWSLKWSSVSWKKVSLKKLSHHKYSGCKKAGNKQRKHMVGSRRSFRTSFAFGRRCCLTTWSTSRRKVLFWSKTYRWNVFHLP